MKFTLIILFTLFTNVLLAQNMKLKELENELGIEIPTDYIQYKAQKNNWGQEVFFKMENWVFWDSATVLEKNVELRKNGALTGKDFAFAEGINNQILFYKDSKKLSTKISHFDKELDSSFYAFSLTEFTNYKKTQELIDEIETVGFENQDLSVIENCMGSLFQYAYELHTSEYDDNFSEDRNKKALELFFKIAEKEHPDAAHELANYYHFQEDTDVGKVIEWKEKAIEFGSKEDIYELADFIIDYKTEEIDRAISLLENLLEEQWYKERALIKLSRIYMRGTGGKLDYEKGMYYTNEGVKLDNYNAISDLAYYYYKGIGVEKSVQKAYDLLVEAEQRITEQTDGGMWGEFIKQLEKELESKE